MQDRIGELAGYVWRYLEDEGESSVSSIVDAVDAPRSKVHMAIGWLAREDKLEFNSEGRGSTVSLN
ncbi:MAG: winged helix-turn-helix domain-containing protein [Candidatus Nanohaloarchaea archaeon]